MADSVYINKVTDKAGHVINVYCDGVEQALIGCWDPAARGFLPQSAVLDTKAQTLTVHCGVPTAAAEHCGEAIEFDLSDTALWSADYLLMFNRVAGPVDLVPDPQPEETTT